MANRKELELSLASPEAYNGLEWIPGSTEGCGILFQFIGSDCGIGYNHVLEHVLGMDTCKVQKAITEMPNEGGVNVVQEERPKSVHVGNKLAGLFQVSGVLTHHDRSGGSRCARGNHKRLDWWDRVNPSSSSRDCQELGTGITAPTWPRMSPPLWEGMEQAAAWKDASKARTWAAVGVAPVGNASDGVGNRSCHCRKYFVTE